ncbi:EAL domain-containing protein [Pseudomonas putida]|uniref:EAL domain-containing protein n=1 Tax=Pseudomonas putida TaxID=303 RepID=UPI0018AA7714|nr:EAL domain-containing protein [Pseudomonas putida]MBF8668307.1 EAL domain-containing protein [Pseudomonas putida]MBF8710874.1 EAL domain-containing protein [Pseudomonas putida]
MDISSKGSVFVATSTAAFAAYETTRDDLSASITSPNDAVVMRTFGDQNIISLESNPIRLCSKHFDFCINAAVHNSIFSFERLKLLVATVLAGACFGILIWYSIAQLLKNKRTMAYRLKRAIKNDQIDLHYQPIVHARNGSISGFKALARWTDKVEGPVPPGIFIKLAEDLGVSQAFSRAIISKALKECKSILAADPDVYLSLNLNTADLLSNEILNHLKRSCAEHGISSSQVAIEILETSTTELSTLQKSIEEYRLCGFLIFIDDFGTGYSSLSYLSHLKIDKIKIDKTFTQSIGIDSSAEFILTQIKKIASSIGASVIYEGIETETQRQVILRFNQGALAQGWLFSKAIPIDQLQEKMSAIDSLSTPQ